MAKTKYTGTLKTIIETEGLKVVEARKNLLVTVKPCDTQANRRSPEGCAFAQACHREYSAKRIIFLRSTAYIQTNGQLVRYMLPWSVQKEIMAFDRGGKIMPGEYLLMKPSRGKRLSSHRKRQKDYRSGVKRKKKVIAGHHRSAEIRTVQW